MDSLGIFLFFVRSQLKRQLGYYIIIDIYITHLGEVAPIMLVLSDKNACKIWSILESQNYSKE